LELDRDKLLYDSKNVRFGNCQQQQRKFVVYAKKNLKVHFHAGNI
jgi:hypothetical protein